LCIVKKKLKRCFTSYKVWNYFTADRLTKLLISIVFTYFITIRQKQITCFFDQEKALYKCDLLLINTQVGGALK